MELNELVRQSYEIAKAHGWEERPIPIPEMIALIHSEASEALEEYRNGRPLLYIKDGKPEGLASEFADILIRIGHYSKVLGINLNEALRLKLKYNKTRPYRHGGKKA